MTALKGELNLDTPEMKPLEGPIEVHDCAMADKQIRRNRPRDEAVTLVRGRVRESTSKAIHNAAAESGVSVGLYLELLTQRIRHQEGELPILVESELALKELPISA